MGASFTKGSGVSTPFGNNQYLRSTKGIKTESYTVSAAACPTETVDGSTEKILRKGVVLAKITSGPEIGKVGPYKGGTAANEVQTVATTGTPTGGTFRLSFMGATTGTIAYNAAAAAVQAALEALPNVQPGDVVASGGALPSAVTLTWGGRFAGKDVAAPTLDTNGLTGGTSPTVVIATTTPGGQPTSGATDGRGDPENIVGINDTFLPWQLLEHDENVAAVTNCTAVQAWCYELNASDAYVALTTATADSMRGGRRLDINFS